MSGTPEYGKFSHAHGLEGLVLWKQSFFKSSIQIQYSPQQNSSFISNKIRKKTNLIFKWILKKSRIAENYE